MPAACPMCGASYAAVEAALARGETVERAAPAVILARSAQLDSSISERPSLLASLLIALGFAVALFATLASFALFGMLLSSPADGHHVGSSRGFETFIFSMAIGWGMACGACLIMALNRRPVAGLLLGMALGLAAALVYGFAYR